MTKDRVKNNYYMFTGEEVNLFLNCTLCPRKCKVNRFTDASGYCNTGAGFEVASVTIHKGEEPVVSGSNGICNIFFTGCNLHCIYCQNYEISHPIAADKNYVVDYEELLDSVEKVLSKGIHAIGFVSPSHVVPQVKAIIRGLNQRGLHPVTVYNTNGYDNQTVIRSLEGMVDVYLPDLKYFTGNLSKKYSDAYYYPEVAIKAIKEMYYQMGSILITDINGQVEKGLIIRHLILPGHVEESKRVLQYIAEEISTGIHLSLMSQYHQANEAQLYPPLNRTLYREEYESVVEEMQKLGFRNGWIQDMDSHSSYLPDFKRDHPFEQ